MSKDTENFINYIDKVNNKLVALNSLGDELVGGFIGSGSVLGKTDKEARVNARIKALRENKEFDESSTPPEELETVEDDTIDELVRRKIENLFKE